jgi:extradiol dioxygenase family protein
MLQPFHLAIPVHSLSAARDFYGRLFGCAEGRSSEQWVDFDFFGHQVVAHLDPGRKPHVHHNEVDGHDVPVPHFGVVLEWQAWQTLAERLRKAGTPIRNRTRYPLRGPGGRAGDDVPLRPVRQRARVQGVQGPFAAVCEVDGTSRRLAFSARPRDRP